MMKMTCRGGVNQKTSNKTRQFSSNFHMHECLWYMGHIRPRGHVRPRGTSPCLLDGLTRYSSVTYESSTIDWYMTFTLTNSKDEDQSSSSCHVDYVGMTCYLWKVHPVTHHHTEDRPLKQRLRFNAILTHSGNFAVRKWPPTPLRVDAERCVQFSLAQQGLAITRCAR